MASSSQKLINKDAKSKEKSLKQKMAQSVVGSAPSMIPGPRISQGEVPPAPEVKEAIPMLDELIADTEDRETIRQLISKSIEIAALLKPLEKQQDAIKDRIKVQLSGYGITSMLCDGAKVSYTMTERKTLNHTKLVAAGVDVETIVACTDVTRSSMLKITPAKE
jgi:hypothetical protein